jgi:hypothetical protein
MISLAGRTRRAAADEQHHHHGKQLYGDDRQFARDLTTTARSA